MSVRTKVNVELEITTGSNWGDDCTIAQVKKQSLDDAKRILSKTIDTNNLIRIAADPKVLNIIIIEDL